MIPVNILALLFIFVVLYAIGFLLSIYVSVRAFKEKNILLGVVGLLLLALYVLFYLGLI